MRQVAPAACTRPEKSLFDFALAFAMTGISDGSTLQPRTQHAIAHQLMQSSFCSTAILQFPSKSIKRRTLVPKQKIAK